MLEYLKKVDIGTTISLLMILFLSAGFLVLNDYISNVSTIIMWVLVLVYLFFRFKSLVLTYLTPSLIILVSYALSSIIMGDSAFVVMAGCFGFVVALVFVSTRNFKNFQASYIEIMRFLCAVSLVGFLCLTLLPFLGQYLSSFTSITKGGMPFYNFFIYIHKPYIVRNTGMFWEPGAYQAFVNLALLFEILKPKPSVFNIALFLTTIITTFSTTGFFAVFLIFAIALLNRNKELRRTRKIFMYFLPVLGVLYFYNSEFLNDTSSYSTFGKVSTFIENEEWVSGSESSSTVRFYSITKTMEAFFDSPLTGQGAKGLEEMNRNYTFGMNTCTFANWFGKYGIFYGIMMLVGFIRFSSLLGHNKGFFVKVLIFLFFFVITVSENFSESVLLNMLCLYGFNEKQIVCFKTYEMLNNSAKDTYAKSSPHVITKIS